MNVIVRYLTTFSFSFSEELLVNLFVWITMLGASIVA
ncbi:TRAP transporter small permease subunit [Acetomicrobium sp. S15 = DSM 107314]